VFRRIRCRIKHVLIEDVGTDNAGLISTLNLHRNVGTAKYEALLAALQFASQLFLWNCAGIGRTEKRRNGLAY